MEDKNNLYIIAIVGIVAVFGIVLMVVSSANHNVYGPKGSIISSTESTDSFGQAAKVVDKNIKCVGPATQNCTVGVGACKRSGIKTRTCSARGVWSAWSACSAVAGTPTSEVCDNIDNDCDGTIDEGLTATRSCNVTGGVGSQSDYCANGLWYSGSCIVTSCNNGYVLRNNTCVVVNASCSGPSTQICTVGLGACYRTGTQSRTCTNGVWSAWSACSAVAGTPTTEICDNIDNDCDGTIDEGLTATQSCSIANGVGSQSRTCSYGSWNPWGTCNVTSCNPGYYMSPNSTCIPSAYCSDTDGGDTISSFTYGSITGLLSNGTYFTYYDTCYDNKTVMERTCNAIYPSLQYHPCANSCSGGMCIPGANSVCYDSDGNNPSISGTVTGIWGPTGESFVRNDYCDTTVTVMEHICINSMPFFEITQCSTGCSSGACY
ncbi:MAG: MopE-related protein [Candidatus Woesearchaeota archaeon]